MKKIILSCLATFAIGITTFAGQMNWDAGDFTADFANGTGYLIQVTAGTTSIAAISNYIQTKGCTYSGTDVTFSKLSSANVTSDSDASYFIDSTRVNLNAGTYNQLFVLVFSADKSKFAIYDSFKTATVNDVTVSEVSFGTSGSYESWTTGKVGVPEPTALALLALGVAGLALRRKHV